MPPKSLCKEMLRSVIKKRKRKQCKDNTIKNNAECKRHLLKGKNVRKCNKAKRLKGQNILKHDGADFCKEQQE